MNITAKMVKELREKTGAGMMDCKKALTATDGDMDKAVDYLREKGLGAAEKKAGRIAVEGVTAVKVSEDGKSGAVVEINAETDFVAKNEKFLGYVNDVIEQVSKTTATDIDGFLAEPWELDNSKTVAEELSTQISVIGENMRIRRFDKITAEDGFVEAYLHGGGRIAVLVEMECGVDNDTVREAAKNIAMQIAAIAPKYLNRDAIPQEYIEHEQEILKSQAMNEDPNKPENIIEKIIIGRLNKELKAVSLVDQEYVKDSDLTVQQYIDKVAKEVGSNFEIKRFVRFETGEGLEKKEENFADEVAKQMKN
ncbi:MAG TPA: elongation factor Ts [Clostridiales bacterium]|nr:elongation factor Ts [Clostridiales bacterium]